MKTLCIVACGKRKIFLLKKAIVGLYPDEIFGKVLWIGEI